MIKRLVFLLFLITLGFAGWYIVEHPDEMMTYVPLSKEHTILTFEAQTSAEELMRTKEKLLLKTANHSFGTNQLKYMPFLLMNVKFVRADKKTEEAKLIWNLENGEMVLDTNSFETTHGFEDCINAKAVEDDFRILQQLNRHGGASTKDALSQELGMDGDTLYERIEALRKKHLVATRGDVIRIHLESPLMHVVPSTKISHPFVTKAVDSQSQIHPHYSKDQIHKLTKAAFGQDFAIRSEHLLFVPIFQITIKNPDGSTLKTYWNGMTGKKIELKRLI